LGPQNKKEEVEWVAFGAKQQIPQIDHIMVSSCDFLDYLPLILVFSFLFFNIIYVWTLLEGKQKETQDCG
jgi:type II secretory pathway component PulF